ncbi:AzlD domain-containing protein [Reinekea sp.]|jgi:branched-subunit amino acid transport protein|uniref:AzlD domain-containing protein n=1 Tax=Reinekea sp. TaxID=1970455 RepID=UPI002A8089F0|nr:AzlD domain-containing protein [Reinekea sp.]
MSDALLILGMIAVTWGVRAAPFVLSNLVLSSRLLKFLNVVPAGVLAALVAEPILTSAVHEASPLQPELLAALICLILGLMRAPMLVTVIVGMGSFWLLRLAL